MNTSRPDTIKIGHVTFLIRWVDRFDEDRTRHFGMCITDDQTLVVSERLKGPRMFEVFMHELLHALSWMFGLDDGSKEEHFVTLLPRGLAMLFVDNPDLRLWMWELLEEGDTP